MNIKYEIMDLFCNQFYKVLDETMSKIPPQNYSQVVFTDGTIDNDFLCAGGIFLKEYLSDINIEVVNHEEFEEQYINKSNMIPIVFQRLINSHNVIEFSTEELPLKTFFECTHNQPCYCIFCTLPYELSDEILRYRMPSVVEKWCQNFLNEHNKKDGI